MRQDTLDSAALLREDIRVMQLRIERIGTVFQKFNPLYGLREPAVAQISAIAAKDFGEQLADLQAQFDAL